MSLTIWPERIHALTWTHTQAARRRFEERLKPIPNPFGRPAARWSQEEAEAWLDAKVTGEFPPEAADSRSGAPVQPLSNQQLPSVVPRTVPKTGGKKQPKPSPSWAPRVLDLEGAGYYCGLSYWTIRDLVQSGKLPTVKIPGRSNDGKPLRRILIDIKDLDALIDKSKEVSE